MKILAIAKKLFKGFIKQPEHKGVEPSINPVEDKTYGTPEVKYKKGRNRIQAIINFAKSRKVKKEGKKQKRKQKALEDKVKAFEKKPVEEKKTAAQKIAQSAQSLANAVLEEFSIACGIKYYESEQTFLAEEYWFDNEAARMVLLNKWEKIKVLYPQEVWVQAKAIINNDELLTNLTQCKTTKTEAQIVIQI